MNYLGPLRKMKAVLEDTGNVIYQLPLGEDLTVPVQLFLGKQLRLAYQGEIHCIHCDRKTSKSFNQGYCFPCLRRLACCDTCIVKPELCHYDQGTCREPEWGRDNCMQPHIVYLANSSGLKVGITRKRQIPTRWIDQGATQALAILEVPSRHVSGMVEMILKSHVSDRTQWQRMLKGEAEAVDLQAERDRLLGLCRDEIEHLLLELGPDSIQRLPTAQVTTLRYPVLEYPVKVKSLNFDKQREVGGLLLGVKGQYLIFDTGVINIRKFAGYEVALEV